MTDSDTATSRCSRPPAPIVWFRLPLTPATPRGVAPLAVLRDEATTVVSQGAFSVDNSCSGSLQSCAQKNEKLGMEATGNGNPPPGGGSQAPPNENPEPPPEVEAGQDDVGAGSVTNAEKDDLQAAANVGEQYTSSSVMPWQAIGPPVLKLTSLLRDTSGMEKEHEPASSRRRLISWQWLQESCDWSACSCIHGCSA